MIYILEFYIKYTTYIRLPSLIKFKNPIKYIRGIPKIIFRTHKHRYINTMMYNDAHISWLKHNPDYNIVWYNNRQCDKFMEDFGERENNAYKKLIPGAFKADLWRLCVLYKFGGIYVDSYAVCCESMNKIINKGTSKGKKHQFISDRKSVV